MDNNAAANNSMARHIANASVKGAMCNKCGSTLVAWAKSKRTGKSYLCDATVGVPGKVIPMPHRPHFKTCKGGN